MTSEAFPSPRSHADLAEPSYLAFLQAGIPLSLLLDLIPTEGPDSHELYRQEVHA